MDCHEVDYKLIGDDMQIVEIELDPGETVIAEAGAMNYMEGSIGFEAKMGDGSAADQGFMGKLLGAGKRALTGESIFMTHFTNNGSGRNRVAFAAPYPGKIIPLDMAAIGGEVICQKDAFLCAALGTRVTITFNKRFGAGFFGGEGFILQKLTGPGLAFVELEAVSDVTVRLDIPDTNLNAWPTLDLFNSPSWHFRFLIVFDLTGLPATAVAEACTLRLTNTWEGSGEDAVPTLVARIVETWEENEVTWMSTPGYANPTYADVAFVPPVYDIEVTSRVDDWLSGYAVNHGFIIDTDEDPTATRFSFASREHDEEEWRPKLILHYAY